MLDVADKRGADHVQRAGLGSQHRLAVQVAEHEGADAQRVAHPDQLLVGHGDQGIAALKLHQGLGEAVEELGAAGAGDEVEDRLGVRGGLEDRAFLDELVALATDLYWYREIGFEPGFDGITVQLWRTGADNLANTADDVLHATTATDVYGYYLFSGLAAGNYFIRDGIVVVPKNAVIPPGFWI